MSKPNKCPICFDSETECILDCKHELCKKCFVNIVKHNGLLLSCPICRNNMHCKIDTVISYYCDADDLIDFVKGVPYCNEQTNETLCDKCETNIADNGCHDCCAKLCNKCWLEIHKIGKLTEHKKVSVNDIKYKIKCPHHPNYYREFICLHDECEHTDDMYLCIICQKSKKHKNHQPELINDLVPNLKDNINEMSNALNSKIKNVSQKIINLNSYTSDVINANVNKINNDIDEYYKKIEEHVKFLKVSTKNEVMRLVNLQKYELLCQKKMLNEYIIELIKANAIMKECIESPEDFILISSYIGNYDKLEYILNKDTDTMGNISFDFTNIEHQKMDLLKYFYKLPISLKSNDINNE